MANNTSTSTKLWREYERLCDIAERAVELHGREAAPATWKDRLEYALDEAATCQSLELVYGEQLVNALIERNDGASMAQIKAACESAWDSILNDAADEAAMYNDLRNGG